MSSRIFYKNLNLKTKQISVIVPIANYITAAKFVYEYLAQAPSFMEFILVYDYQDPAIASIVTKELKNFKYTQIIAIQCYVQSPGLARNIGLSQASGYWIAFWDCDDRVNLELFLSDFQCISDSESDIVIWNFYKSINGQGLNRNFLVLHDSSIINVATNPGIWRMLFKKQFISNINFTNLLWGEDQLYFCNLLTLDPKLMFRDESFYEYCIGNSTQLTAQKTHAVQLTITSQEVTRILRRFRDNNELRKSIQIVLMSIYMTQLKYSSLGQLPKKMFNLLRGSGLFKFKDRIHALLLIQKLRNRRSIEISGGKVLLSLTGGLGNQLFQYAAGTYISIKLRKELFFESEIGLPRTNEKGKPSLFSVVDEISTAHFAFAKYRGIFRRLTNYMLRIFLANDRGPTNWICRLLLKLAMPLISLRIFSGTNHLRFLFPNNLGYETIISKGRNLFIRGYFQTYKYLETAGLYEKMMEIKPISTSPELALLSNEILSKKVLIVHVRLGDYLGLDDFGIPSADYYLGAINEASELSTIDEIWLFSDEPELAQKTFESAGVTKVRIIKNFSQDDSQMWELMRYGSAYVIGNSSFAWWAAKLSYKPNAIVICPSPWFKRIKEPRLLIPPNWLRRDAKFT